MNLEKGQAVDKWHIVMTAGCNLRCPHCATDFGRFGKPGGVMSLATARRLADRIAEGLDPAGGPAAVSFGGGETFLHFDRFLAIADLIAARAGKGRVRLDVTTNGVRLDEARLRSLARRGIGLTFSLDGPAPLHDAARRTAGGAGSFRPALAHFLRYRAMGRRRKSPPACSIHSVYRGDRPGSLREMVGFFTRLGLPVQEIVPLNHSRFEPPASRPETRRKRALFLAELGAWAREQAAACTPPHFLSTYRGPALVYSAWSRLMAEREKHPCTPGRGVLAVHMDGSLYPCEAYIGVDRWKLGHVDTGVDGRRLRAFTGLCRKAEARCAACESHLACEKICLATFPGLTPCRNLDRGCGMARKIAGVMRHSYAILTGERHD